jgi:hypothetical protein
MTTMRWYNPTTRSMEDTEVPVSDTRAIELLSEDEDSEQYIAEYMGCRQTHDIVESLIFTGQTFQMVHREEQPPF